MKSFVRILVALMVLIPAAAAFAQTSEVKLEGEVVAVYGDTLVVRMSTGEVKEFHPPADRKFNVDGQMLSVSELKPGTKLSATVTTTKTPEVVRTVVLKNAEVVKVQGSSLFVKQDGQFKSYTVPAGFTFVVDGGLVPVSKLTPGTKLNAEIVYKSETIHTEQEVMVAGSAPAPIAEVAPAPAPAPAPEPEPAPEMPKTAGYLPLIGLLGLAMLAAGVAIKR